MTNYLKYIALISIISIVLGDVYTGFPVEPDFMSGPDMFLSNPVYGVPAPPHLVHHGFFDTIKETYQAYKPYGTVICK